MISPSQAREIGALLRRLTNENTQFLKARDAAVASRNEALNRAAALEAELELRQQQHRWAMDIVPFWRSQCCIFMLPRHVWRNTKDDTSCWLSPTSMCCLHVAAL